MDKLKKNRRIIIILLAVTILISVVFMVVKGYESYAFKDWIYNKYGAAGTVEVKMDEPGLGIAIAAAAISAFIWFLFLGLAFRYSKSKSPKVQGRKWPYIVMLVFSAIAAVWGVYSFVTGGNGVVSFTNIKPDIQNDITATLNNSYGIIKIAWIIGLVLDVVIVVLSIFALVIIKKVKTAKEMQMTNEVIQTGIDERSQVKEEVQNDLP